MDVLNIQKVIWRWKWLIIVPVLITLAALLVQMMLDQPTFTADVTFQVTTPDREDVSITGNRAWTSDRDEITIATNNFLEIATYAEAKRRTQESLSLEEDYSISVDADTGSDLITLQIEASTPELAAKIANEHAIHAVDLFGEIRAAPSTEALKFFGAELQKAEDLLTAAEAELIAFQQENKIVNLPSEVALQEQLLTELEASRDRVVIDSISQAYGVNSGAIFTDVGYQIELLKIDLEIQQTEVDQLKLERDSTLAQSAIVAVPSTTTGGTATSTPALPSQTATAVSRLNTQILEAEQELGGLRLELLALEKARIEENRNVEPAEVSLDQDALVNQINVLVSQQRERLNEVSILEPQYNELVDSVNTLRDSRNQLATLMEETELQRTFSQLVTFLQVIEPAEAPSDSEGSSARTLIMGLIGSLGLGILFAFFSDYLFGSQEDDMTTPVGPVAAASTRSTE